MNLKTILTFSIIVLFFSCGRNKYEKRLVGNWYSFDENEKLTLDKDSLLIESLHEKVKWNSTKDLLKFNYKDVFNDSINKVSLKYIFKNDTLIITRYNDLENTQIKFIKATKFLDVLFSKNNVNIELPVNSNIENIRVDPKHAIKIFLELENDSIVPKTQYSENLSNLNNDLEKHRSLFSKEIEWFKEDHSHIYKELNNQELESLWVRFHVSFSIFADKGISTKELKFYYNKLKEVKEINKIYQIYGIDESQYVDFYKLKGVKL